MNAWRKFWYKVARFEYWPFNLLYLPVYLYYPWLALKSRSFFFFTSSNPGIEFGGMSGEKKSQIFDIIPKDWIPKTLKFNAHSSMDQVITSMKQNGIDFPIVMKPDIGERGWKVQKVSDLSSLEIYLDDISVPFLVQEFVHLPVELGIFYVRHPEESDGIVTSVVQKNFLSVTGDGQSSIRQLLKRNQRAQLLLDFNSPYIRDLDDVLPSGEEIVVEEIGNHVRGTEFLNANAQIDQGLCESMDRIAKQIPGFYFGRFDIRCSSIDELRVGENFAIIELNGAGAEPGHIYQPGYPIWKAYRDILWHLNLLGRVSIANKKRGYKPWSFNRGFDKIKEIRGYNLKKKA